MFHAVLGEFHIMVGMDWHGEITATPVPAPAPFTPHLVGMLLHGIIPMGPSFTDRGKTVANGMGIVQKGSDISWLIPHVPVPTWPPLVLAVLITSVGSGSKSYFGPASVVAEKKPIAAALIPISTQIQLNCGTVPTPTGLVDADGTVVCGMTWGDILGGLVAMAVDCAVQAALNKLCSYAGNAAGNKVSNWVVKQIVQNAVPFVIQQITGSPLGYTWSAGQHGLGSQNPDDSHNPYNPGNWGNIAGDSVTNAMNGPTPSPGAPANVPPSASAHPAAHDQGVEDH